MLSFALCRRLISPLCGCADGNGPAVRIDFAGPLGLTGMFKRMRSWAMSGLLALSAVLVPAAVHAEGETGGSNTIDTSAASTAVTNMKDAITDFMTGDLMDAILAVIGAAVVIWLLFLGWKLIKRGGQKAG